MWKVLYLVTVVGVHLQAINGQKWDIKKMEQCPCADDIQGVFVASVAKNPIDVGNGQILRLRLTNDDCTARVLDKSPKPGKIEINMVYHGSVDIKEQGEVLEDQQRTDNEVEQQERVDNERHIQIQSRSVAPDYQQGGADIGQQQEGVDIGQQQDGVDIGQQQYGVDIGQQDGVDIGQQQYGVDIGQQQDGVDIGQQDGVDIGQQQDGVDIGQQQYGVYIGQQQDGVDIGQQDGVDIGQQQDGVNIGQQQDGVDIGQQQNRVDIEQDQAIEDIGLLQNVYTDQVLRNMALEELQQSMASGPLQQGVDIAQEQAGVDNAQEQSEVANNSYLETGGDQDYSAEFSFNIDVNTGKLSESTDPLTRSQRRKRDIMPFETVAFKIKIRFAQKPDSNDGIRNDQIKSLLRTGLQDYWLAMAFCLLDVKQID